MPETSNGRARIQREFGRAAPGFAERTAGRFDDMDVIGFSRLPAGGSVLEVGAGTGNFLTLFQDHARRCIALDLTTEMLAEVRSRYPRLTPVQGDAFHLPFRSGSVDLVASAQTLHHIAEPVPILSEMRRVAGPAGRVLVVDQHSTENYEQRAIMNQLESIRDPSHAASRSPSVMRMLIRSAGLRIVDERSWEGRNSLSQWMWPGEFPASRIRAVRDFIERFGSDTGMAWEREGDDWTFTRRRLMILAEAG